MRLVVFGQMDPAKHHLIRRALATGYQVSTLGSPETVGRTKHTSKNLTIVHGATYTRQNMRRLLRGADAVLCLLHNPRRPLDRKTRSFLQTLVAGMEEHSTRRLVVFSYLHKDRSRSVEQGVADNWLARWLVTLAGKQAEPTDVAAMLKSTNIDWTVVGRPVSLDGAANGSEQFHMDVAKHMVGQITDVAYLRRTLLLSAES